MINKRLSVSQLVFRFSIPLSMLAVLVALMNSSWLSTHDELPLAITIDLMLVVPLVYFLLIRKTAIPNATVLPVIIIGLLLGSFFLPSEHQHYLKLFRNWVLPVIELIVLSLVFFKVRKAVLTFKQLSGYSPDFFTTLRNTCKQMLPKALVTPMVMEISVFYYGLVNWKKPALPENAYTYHKKSGTIALMLAILFILLVETVVVHLLLVRWSDTGAMVFSGLSLYSGLQLFGFMKSLSKRPIILHHERVQLRYGIMAETAISLNEIEQIEKCSKDLEEGSDTLKLSPLGNLEMHNVVIHCKNPQTRLGLYGMKKKYTTLALHVDDRDGFVSKVQGAIQAQKAQH